MPGNAVLWAVDEGAAVAAEAVARAAIGGAERRTAELFAIVAAQRKGFRNKFKSWWGKASSTQSAGREGGGGEAPRSPQRASPAPQSVLQSPLRVARRQSGGGAATLGEPIVVGLPSTAPSSPAPAGDEEEAAYAENSIEAMTQELGDLLLLLQDYESALAHYRYVASDYKGDKQWSLFAYAQLQTALCMHLTFRQAKETEGALELALSSFMRARNQASVVRTALLFALMLKGREEWKAAASILLGANNQEADNLTAAMLLEEAAACFVGAGMPRKASFHMLLAGHRHGLVASKGGVGDARDAFIAHALRCYRAALAVYEGKGWQLMEDHVNFTMCKHLFHMRHYEDSVTHFLRLVASNAHPASRQSSYVKDFVHVYHQWAGAVAAEAPGARPPRLVLPLPVIDQASVSVTLVEQAQPAGATPAHDAVWLQLEEQLMGAASTSSQTASLIATFANLSGKARQALAKRYRGLAKRRDVTVVGEPIRVACRLRNPIKVAIQIHDVRVHATGVDYRCDPQVVMEYAYAHFYGFT